MCELTQFQISCRLVPFYTHKLTRIIMSVTQGSCSFSSSDKCKSHWSHNVSQLKLIPSKEGSSMSPIFVLPFHSEAWKHVCKRKQFVCCFIRIKNKSIKTIVRPKHTEHLAVHNSTEPVCMCDAPWCATANFCEMSTKHVGQARYTHAVGRHLTKTVFCIKLKCI